MSDNPRDLEHVLHSEMIFKNMMQPPVQVPQVTEMNPKIHPLQKTQHLQQLIHPQSHIQRTLQPQMQQIQHIQTLTHQQMVQQHQVNTQHLQQQQQHLQQQHLQQQQQQQIQQQQIQQVQQVQQIQMNVEDHDDKRGEKKARKISRHACEYCSKLRKKCDGVQPNHCSRCVQKGIQCVYIRRQKRGPKVKRQKISHHTQHHNNHNHNHSHQHHSMGNVSMNDNIQKNTLTKVNQGNTQTQNNEIGPSPISILYPHQDSFNNFTPMFQNPQFFSYYEQPNTIINQQARVTNTNDQEDVIIEKRDMNIHKNDQLNDGLNQPNNVTVDNTTSLYQQQTRSGGQTYYTDGTTTTGNTVTTSQDDVQDELDEIVEMEKTSSEDDNMIHTCRIVICIGGVTEAMKIPQLARTFVSRKTKIMLKEKDKKDGINKTIQYEVKLVCVEKALEYINVNELKEKETLFQVFTDQDEYNAWKGRGDPVIHIELRKWADVLLFAPCTANILTKISNGICDDLATCIAKAWNFEKPFICCPSMNTMMWLNSYTQKQVNSLKSELGIEFIDPIESNEKDDSMSKENDIIQYVEKKFVENIYHEKKYSLEF